MGLHVRKIFTDGLVSCIVVKSRLQDIRVHFKNTLETINALRGLSLKKAQAYLKAVLAHKRVIPFRRYNRGIGRTGQATEFGVTKGNPFFFISCIIHSIMTKQVRVILTDATDS
jgi:ribosomal protein L22